MQSAKFFFLVFLLIALFFPKPAFAENLLLNSSFENITGGAPDLWTKNVSTATLTTSTIAKIGTASASLNKTNSTTGLIYLYQDVDIEPESFYSLSGWAVKNTPKFNWVILRISWRTSSAEISKTDSSQLTSDSTNFQQLKIDSVQAPSSVVKARIELAANIVTVNPDNSALFDDINFSQVTAPEQPTSTPAPTPSQTPTPIPKPSQTATPTKTSTPSPAPTKTATPTPTPTPTPETFVLGIENVSPSPSVVPEATSSSKFLGRASNLPILPFVFIILGASVFIGSGVMYFRTKKEEVLQITDETDNQ